MSTGSDLRSDGTSQSQNIRPKCACGEDAAIATSWTEDNPGRRFFGCPNWKTADCHFFIWLDDAHTPLARGIINRLRRENIELRRKVVDLQHCIGYLQTQLSNNDDKIPEPKQVPSPRTTASNKLWFCTALWATAVFFAFFTVLLLY